MSRAGRPSARVGEHERLIPLRSLTTDRTLAVEAVAALVATLDVSDPSPGLVAAIDQIGAAEAEYTPGLKAAASDDGLDMLELTGGHAMTVRLAFLIAAMRMVEARCRHTIWPPNEAKLPRPTLVSLTARAAICANPACVQALLRRWHDDGRCEICEQPSEHFFPHLGPLGPYLISAEVCPDCHAKLNGEGGWS